MRDHVLRVLPSQFYVFNAISYAILLRVVSGYGYQEEN